MEGKPTVNVRASGILHSVVHMQFFLQGGKCMLTISTPNEE